MCQNTLNEFLDDINWFLQILSNGDYWESHDLYNEWGWAGRNQVWTEFGWDIKDLASEYLERLQEIQNNDTD